MGSISHILPDAGVRTHERYPTWEGIMPLPPDGLLWSVGGSSLEVFLVVADAWDQAIARYLQPDSTVLEIGCGCGRNARSLLRHPLVSHYVGFDVIAQNIAWCNHFLAPLAKAQAEFLHYDVFSAEYNPGGRMRGAELVFPCQDGSAGVVAANSVFTHLLEPDARHYLSETARVLSPSGHALLSFHTNVPEGIRFAGTEARIDIEPEYFVELAAAANLVCQRRIAEFCGQSLFVFSRRDL
jgi:SAM-dependent methyltransferase